MRPNIEITHTLNGRVKDFAAERDYDTVDEAYRDIIETGLEQLEQGHEEPASEPRPAKQVEPPSDIEAVLETWEPDTEADVMRARGETVRVFEWLLEQGEPKKRAEIVDAVNDTEMSDRGWWERCVQPGLRRLTDAGAVEYRSGYHDYAAVVAELDLQALKD